MHRVIRGQPADTQPMHGVNVTEGMKTKADQSSMCQAARGTRKKKSRNNLNTPKYTCKSSQTHATNTLVPHLCILKGTYYHILVSQLAQRHDRHNGL